MVLLLAALGKYQTGASLKAEKEAENAAAIEEVEAYNREIKKQIAATGASDEAAPEETESPYKDGSFEGSADGFGGPIRVAVTIEGGDLTKVDVLEAGGEDPAYFSQAQAVIDEILSTQGVAVDTVSGATFSSTGLINAVTEALRAASK